MVIALIIRGNFLKARTKIKTEERTRLAVELHDSLSQNLSGIALQLAATRTALSRDVSSADHRLDIAQNMIDSCRLELKRCLYDLRHRAIDEHDLTRAAFTVITPVIGDANINIRIRVPRHELNDTTTHTVLSILRELATNAIRHGKATRLQIAGAYSANALLFSIRDNGSGFDPQTAPGVTQGHFGLNGVHERLSRLGGKITINTTPQHGTYIRFTLARTERNQT